MTFRKMYLMKKKRKRIKKNIQTVKCGLIIKFGLGTNLLLTFNVHRNDFVVVFLLISHPYNGFENVTSYA